MKPFEYGDQEISHRQITFSVASVVLGTGILTLPRVVAAKTEYYDGWICISAAGALSLFFVWVCAALASRFPKKNYFEFIPMLVTNKVSWVITLFTAVYFLLITSFVIRGISNVSQRYLFDKTPVEAIVLAVLLVVVYAVAGSRAALLRINMMFFPIVMTVTCLVQLLNLGEVEIDNLRPLFVTKFTGLAEGTMESIFSYLGYSVVLLYISMMNRPAKAPKAAVMGLIPAILLYLLIYTVAIGVFSHNATIQITFPTVELAKEAQVPGGILERLESLYFTIWIMTIVNTACMGYDVSIAALQSLFPNVKKMTWISILSPLIFFFSMTLYDFNLYSTVGSYIGYLGIGLEMLLPSILLLIAVFRKVKTG